MRRIETLAPHGSDEPFNVGVLPRGALGREQFFNPEGCRGIRPTGERVIAISDEIARCAVPRERLAELLPGPRRRWVFRHRHVHDATPRVDIQQFRETAIVRQMSIRSRTGWLRAFSLHESMAACERLNSPTTNGWEDYGGEYPVPVSDFPRQRRASASPRKSLSLTGVSWHI